MGTLTSWEVAGPREEGSRAAEVHVELAVIRQDTNRAVLNLRRIATGALRILKRVREAGAQDDQPRGCDREDERRGGDDERLLHAGLLPEQRARFSNCFA